MQIPIVNGIYVDSVGEFRTSYPRNLVPVPKDIGIAKGYLRPAEGITQFATGPGIGRGGINWNGVLYRVMGTKLVRVASDGTVTVLGDVGAGGPVTMSYSFDRLGIAAGGNLYYWNGSTLSNVIDADLGTVVSMKFISGYFMTTDGTSLVVTDLTDPFSVNPLKYGSAESDPDPVLAVDELRNEAYALGRYSIQVFQNVGGDNFPFANIEGATVPKGVIGTHAYCSIGTTFVFVGSGEGETPAVHLLIPGDTQKLSTREIDQALLTYTEAQLAACIVECKVDKNHQLVQIHLPDRTLCYDVTASQTIGEPIWFTLTSSVVGNAIYRARNLVWVYDGWHVEDPSSAVLGKLVDNVATHYGQTTGWEFNTPIVYNEGNAAIIHELELVALPGRTQSGLDPVVWTSYSLDGETFSQERPIRSGKQGERQKRLAWRTQGTLQNYRIQRFRGTSETHMSMARLEAQIEPLFTRPGSNG